MIIVEMLLQTASYGILQGSLSSATHTCSHLEISGGYLSEGFRMLRDPGTTGMKRPNNCLSVFQVL